MRMAPASNKKKSAAQADRDQRAYMTKVMDEVARALNKLVGDPYQTPSPDASDNESEDDEMMATHVLPENLS